ncbi:hypothetical protein GQ44DRAFT_107229 [Phaeosphaeriaceae sp. PMI808]|nr:hypothetical protein GQ44DRAFT_107229 [Phaeosphaeriaceae sp. PMI808]
MYNPRAMQRGILTRKQIPAETLFLHLPELEDYLTKASLEKTVAKHGALLVETIKSQYKDTIRKKQSLIEAGKITFELLWTLLKPNGILLAPTEGFDGEPRGYQISYVTQQCGKDSNLERYVVEARYIDFGSSGYVKRSTQLQFDKFQGTRDVKSLPGYPLEFLDSETRTSLTDRGRNFFKLKLPEIWEYDAKARSQDGKDLEVHGRVVLDNVSYHAYTKRKDRSEAKESKHGESQGQDQLSPG